MDPNQDIASKNSTSKLNETINKIKQQNKFEKDKNEQNEYKYSHEKISGFNSNSLDMFAPSKFAHPPPAPPLPVKQTNRFSSASTIIFCVPQEKKLDLLYSNDSNKRAFLQDSRLNISNESILLSASQRSKQQEIAFAAAAALGNLKISSVTKTDSNKLLSKFSMSENTPNNIFLDKEEKSNHQNHCNFVKNINTQPCFFQKNEIKSKGLFCFIKILF